MCSVLNYGVPCAAAAGNWRLSRKQKARSSASAELGLEFCVSPVVVYARRSQPQRFTIRFRPASENIQ